MHQSVEVRTELKKTSTPKADIPVLDLTPKPEDTQIEVEIQPTPIKKFDAEIMPQIHEVQETPQHESEENFPQINDTEKMEHMFQNLDT